ncbi:winged helix-turn-helix transcriptional regulator [Sphingosinicella sp.]|uniref:winged helix-turn-helix transcriptional regulator n=1 Tax=Sphingosinicella sp. TaxID=1917971 RepID=UPI004037B662
MISDPDLRRLTAGRWLLPLLALVGARQGARFAEMLPLGLSRSVLAASLAQLIEAGWLQRNPGHGHPLRPEYVLTAAGRPLAILAVRVAAARDALGLPPELLSRWALPAVSRLAVGPCRFSTLRAALAPVTPRALSLALKQLQAAGLIDRALEERYPPIAIYGLTGRGERLAAAMR